MFHIACINQMHKIIKDQKMHFTLMYFYCIMITNMFRPQCGHLQGDFSQNRNAIIIKVFRSIKNQITGFLILWSDSTYFNNNRILVLNHPEDGHVTGRNMLFDIFVNCNQVDTRWQQYSTHLHKNNTQNNKINNSVWTIIQ